MYQNHIWEDIKIKKQVLYITMLLLKQIKSKEIIN